MQKPATSGGLKPLALSQNLMFAKPLSSKNSALKSTIMNANSTTSEMAPSKEAKSERRKSALPFVYPSFQTAKK
jgi:hypothetical protein